MKKCSSCGKVKPLDEFTNKNTYCRSCKAAKQAIRRYQADLKKNGEIAFRLKIQVAEWHITLMKKVLNS